jgi:hypothetical protein
MRRSSIECNGLYRMGRRNVECSTLKAKKKPVTGIRNPATGENTSRLLQAGPRRPVVSRGTAVVEIERRIVAPWRENQRLPARGATTTRLRIGRTLFHKLNALAPL